MEGFIICINQEKYSQVARYGPDHIATQIRQLISVRSKYFPSEVQATEASLRVTSHR